MQGKIIKGIGGFYYIHTGETGIYECRARGIFRKDGQKPLVGDNVEMTVLDETEKTGNVDSILPRKNALIRPAAANVDQALVIFALASPSPNLNLLDRFLICMQQQEIPVIICFNKTDLADKQQADALLQDYRDCGCRVSAVSVSHREGLEDLRDMLKGKTTVVAGPSGVGKSSFTNYLQPNAEMEVGDVSRKIGRGRHTTRHTELIWIEEDTFFLDTPGFSSLYLQDIRREELRLYYPEFAPYERQCRFQGCVHISEPDCAVKQALEEGKISRRRYENYVLLAEELKGRRK